MLANEETDFDLKIVGVVSFGPAKCGSETPGVYTHIDPYLDWINNIINCK